MKTFLSNLDIIAQIWSDEQQITISSDYFHALPYFDQQLFSHLCFAATIECFGSIFFLPEGIFRRDETAEQVIKEVVGKNSFIIVRMGLSTLATKGHTYLQPYCNFKVCLQPLWRVRDHPLWINIAAIHNLHEVSLPWEYGPLTAYTFLGSGNQLIVHENIKRAEAFYHYDARVFEMCRLYTYSKVDEPPVTGVIPIGDPLPAFFYQEKSKMVPHLAQPWPIILELGLKKLCTMDTGEW